MERSKTYSKENGIKVLVAEDNERYLDTAKVAFNPLVGQKIGNFTISDVHYESRPEVAVDRISDYDLVLTDFLFKQGGIQPQPLHDNYVNNYVNRLADGKSLEDIARVLTEGHEESRIKKLERFKVDIIENNEALRYGRPTKKYVSEVVERKRNSLEKERKSLVMDNHGKSDEAVTKEYNELSSKLSNLPTAQRLRSAGRPEYGYGGMIMLEAKDKEVPAVMMTSLHRHKTRNKEASVANSLDGQLAFLPLLEKGVITLEDISELSNSVPSRTIMANAEKDKCNTWRKGLKDGLYLLGKEDVEIPQRERDVEEAELKKMWNQREQTYKDNLENKQKKTSEDIKLFYPMSVLS